VFAASASVHGQCGYEATIIEPPSAPFGSLILGRAINEAGHACGHFSLGLSGLQDAFIWTGGESVIPLGPADGIVESNAADLANGGGVDGADLVVGSYNLDKGMLRAFVHDGSQFITLDPLPGGDWSFGEGINEGQMIVGDSHNLTMQTRDAVFWQDGKPTAIEGLQGPIREATDINEAGQITGWMIHPVTGIGFLWDEGVATILGPVPNGQSSSPQAINDNGEIVGHGRIPCDCSPHAFARQAFLWSKGQWTMLGTLPGLSESVAYDVNNSSQVVGYGWNFGSSATAFLWENGVMHDLNDLVALPDGLELDVARSINDAGQILADACCVGSSAAIVLLTPKRPPLADLNDDCIVSVIDLSILLAQWGQSGGGADLNLDGNIGPFDLAILLAQWTQSK
jgi:probable HAF family extracellular repeat protein